MPVPISNVPRRVVYAASGTGPYAFTFEILANTDIDVYEGDVLLELTTDYTVTINVNGTGSVTLVSAAADQIAIVGARAIQRTSDFTTGGDFFANTVNDELDSLTIFAQQNSEGLGRALIAPQTDPLTIDMTLPRAADRAGKLLAFDSNGDPIVGEDIGNWRDDWDAGVAYRVRDLVKDPDNSNIYRCNTAHTSSGSAPISGNADSAKWDLVIDATAVADAETAQAAAEAAQASAEAAQAAAETAETNAETAETNAETAASNASTSATNASNSATAAASSASAASTSATNAANSATAAATSATNASNSASAASTSASNAATSETNAASSASAASTSASNAASSASAASTSASNASTSATNASNSATAAAASASAAATSASDAEAALASFNATYLGAQASDPSVDNEGDPVTAGDWYFNTSSNISRIYNGSTWANVTLDASTVVAKTSNTGSAVLPAGTTAERDGSPSAGYLRFNSDDGSAEIYDGSAWSAVGGGNTTDQGLYEHSATISSNYTITSGNNAMSAGPITVDSGVTVTVPSGSTWTVI